MTQGTQLKPSVDLSQRSQRAPDEKEAQCLRSITWTISF